MEFGVYNPLIRSRCQVCSFQARIGCETLQGRREKILDNRPKVEYKSCISCIGGRVLYSHSSELAIRAALFLALQPPGKLSPVHEIAEGTGLSSSYLAKILGRLTAAGLVRAFRGPGRGMELGRAPQSITLAAVVRAMDGPMQPERCVLGLRACADECSCALHHEWIPIRAAIQRLLEETTLATLAHGLGEKIDLREKTWVHRGDEAVPSGCSPGRTRRHLDRRLASHGKGGKQHGGVAQEV